MNQFIFLADGRLVSLRIVFVVVPYPNLEKAVLIDLVYSDDERETIYTGTVEKTKEVFAGIREQISKGYNLIDLPEIVAGIEAQAQQVGNKGDKNVLD